MLDLASNNFIGYIPKEIGNMTMLKELDLGINKLQGEIPHELDNLAKLELLTLAHNTLTGTIPSTIFNLSSLTYMRISGNRLVGNLPSENMCQRLPALQELHISRNQLTGRIPYNLWQCTNLQIFSVWSNQLGGSIPRDIGNLTMLTILRLGFNNLTDEKGSPHMMNNLVLGFNEGVEVALPNDEFERSPPTEETTFAVPQISVGIVAEEHSNLWMFLPKLSCTQYLLVRVKLQFGLFSGPSLIPSPVPAIQIGSIQMPLWHPHVGPSLAHLHPSQPPIFQFGQLRYTSPSISAFVQPNKPAKLLTNQNVGVSQPIQPKQETSAHNMMKSDALSRSVDNQPGLVQGHGSISRECFLAEDQGQHNSVMRNFKSISTKESEGLLNTGAVKEKYLTASKGQGPASGGRGKKYVVSVRSKSSFVAPESSRSDFRGGLATSKLSFELGKMLISSILQAWFLLSANHIRPDDKSNISGRNIGMSTRAKMGRDLERNHLQRARTFHTLKRGTIKGPSVLERMLILDYKVGIVRVFEQPGIEAPSDEDDFIEVRSKRQMLLVTKVLMQTVFQFVFMTCFTMNKTLLNDINLLFMPDAWETSTYFTKYFCLGKLKFDSNNNVQTSLGSWGNSQLNQQADKTICLSNSSAHIIHRSPSMINLATSMKKHNQLNFNKHLACVHQTLSLRFTGSAGAAVSAPRIVAKSLSLSTIGDTGKTDVQNGSNSNTNGQNTNSAFKHQLSQQKNMSSQQYNNSPG
ncbi:hypothetical protein EZV62_026908 [Acer yangbiense]|uniref:Uncharacterized protein n=1 Tax=Acer yangbiense TaxID=1000413 RepID=A0A5C7GS43_9ROSI|nr:hypothetical protein EZV62_026908 [Acer yangbiense]